jgi:hypothetical protein
MTYSKTRATKDNTAEYSSTIDSPQETLREREPSSGTKAERSAATIDELNITTSPRIDVTEETLVVPSAAEVKDRFASPEYVNPVRFVVA